MKINISLCGITNQQLRMSYTEAILSHIDSVVYETDTVDIMFDVVYDNSIETPITDNTVNISVMFNFAELSYIVYSSTRESKGDTFTKYMKWKTDKLISDYRDVIKSAIVLYRETYNDFNNNLYSTPPPFTVTETFKEHQDDQFLNNCKDASDIENINVSCDTNLKNTGLTNGFGLPILVRGMSETESRLLEAYNKQKDNKVLEETQTQPENTQVDTIDVKFKYVLPQDAASEDFGNEEYVIKIPTNCFLNEYENTKVMMSDTLKRYYLEMLPDVFTSRTFTQEEKYPKHFDIDVDLITEQFVCGNTLITKVKKINTTFSYYGNGVWSTIIKSFNVKDDTLKSITERVIKEKIKLLIEINNKYYLEKDVMCNVLRSILGENALTFSDVSNES